MEVISFSSSSSSYYFHGKSSDNGNRQTEGSSVQEDATDTLKSKLFVRL